MFTAIGTSSFQPAPSAPEEKGKVLLSCEREVPRHKAVASVQLSPGLCGRSYFETASAPACILDLTAGKNILRMNV